jgi:UDP-glucose 4-epimerase
VKFARVLIIGGSGFIGRHLAATITPLCGHVVTAPRGTPSVGTGALEVDVTRVEEMRALVRDSRPTIVFNLAGRRPAAAEEDPRKTIDLNLLAAIELLRECTLREVSRVVLVGSAEEYGDQATPVSEDAPLRPRSIYGASKAAMTLHALALHASMKAPVVVVRPFSVYGAGAPLHMFVAEAADCAARGVPFRMTEGQQRRDLIHVDDVVEGLIAAATVPEAEGKIFNLGSGESHSMRDVAEMLWRISGTPAELQIGARPSHPGDLAETRANIERAKAVLNWQPRISLEDGLRSTWAAVQKKTGSV